MTLGGRPSSVPLGRCLGPHRVATRARWARSAVVASSCLFAFTLTAGCARPAAPRTAVQTLDLEPPPPRVPATSSTSKPDARPLETFRATVQIDEPAEEQRFLRAWLLRTNGERLAIGPREEQWWRPFANRAVIVRGERVEPGRTPDTALGFRVHTLELAEPEAHPEAQVIGLAEERTYEGRFEAHVWPAGSKLEGETSIVLVTRDGARHWLLGGPRLPTPEGRHVRVHGRQVQISRYVTRPDGPTLWVGATSEH